MSISQRHKQVNPALKTVPVMTKMFYWMVNSILFAFKAVLPINQRKVIYWSKTFRYEGNVKALYQEWSQIKGFTHVWLVKSTDQKQRIHRLSSSTTRAFHILRIQTLYHLSTAKYWIREADLASPGIQPKKDTIVVQLWHAAGAFKKFGADLNRNNELKKIRAKDSSRWNLLLCSSESIVDIYAKAFYNFPKHKIFVSGLPRNDMLFHYLPQSKQTREDLGIPLNKVFILYAPTFRDKDQDPAIFNQVISYLSKSLPDSFFMGVRLYPDLIANITLDTDVLDLTFEEDVEKILSVTGILITDYSSIIFDYALLQRPILFYMPDMDQYTKDRGFYYDLNSFLPGPICKTKETIEDQILNYDANHWGHSIKTFKEKFQPDFDGMNSKRVLNRILEL